MIDPELQLKNTEFAIRNKLIDLLAELSGFKFVTLVIEFKKMIEKQKIAPVILT